MNFKQFLEITGDFSDFVPGWRGGPKGPYEDGKRMPHDKLWQRNAVFQKQQSGRDLEKSKMDLEANPDDPDTKKKHMKAQMDALWNTMPKVDPGHPDPDEEYQGWTNWDTWAVALFLSNDQPHYEATRNKDAGFLKKYASRLRTQLKRFITDGKIELDYVNWNEISDSVRDD